MKKMVLNTILLIFSSFYLTPSIYSGFKDILKKMNVIKIPDIINFFI